ncbi:MAG: phosphotransferase family protein, partial [Promethearchaeota archaeon]
RIHGDLVLSNLILTKKTKRIFFIDWEYSTLADPLIDLAYLISQNNLPLKIQQAIIESYEDHSNFQINQGKLSVYCDLMNLMSGLWYAIHAARLKLMSFSEREHHPPYENFIKLAAKTFHDLNLSWH